MAIQQAMQETDRRREKQREYNLQKGITPKSIIKPVKDIIDGVAQTRSAISPTYQVDKVADDDMDYVFKTPAELGKLLKKLEKEMYACARNLEFEAAASIRDKINRIRNGQFLSEDLLD